MLHQLSGLVGTHRQHSKTLLWCLLSVLLRYGLNCGEGLSSLDVNASIVLADVQQLCRQLLMRLCNGALMFLALGIWVLCHDLLVRQAGLGAPPGGLEGAGYGLKGGKDCHIIICSMRQNCSSLVPYNCELVLDNTSVCDSDLVSVCSVSCLVQILPPALSAAAVTRLCMCVMVGLV